ncbi:MAG: Fic family protein [Bacteroidales bacterium]|nr:Fic family protein [Bacteroidales bacterium]
MKKALHARLKDTIARYVASGIEQQVDYEKFYLYSLITHSTAIEGSTVTEVENQLLFDEGIAAKGRTLNEQMMNVDLKNAYVFGFDWVKNPQDYTPEFLCELSGMVMRRTGTRYSVIGGDFDSSKGDLRKCNVSAGVGGKSYLAFGKVPKALDSFCQWLNSQLHDIDHGDVEACYRLSFEAHFRLVTIHPWVDGNGRTTRLVMNMIQRQLGLIPSIVTKENKALYIQALIDTRESGDMTVIQDVMLLQHIENLEYRILQYQNSVVKPLSDTVNDTVNIGFPQRLLALMKAQPAYTYEQYAGLLNVSRATVARNIKKLSEAGYVHRVGADKDGYWRVK